MLRKPISAPRRSGLAATSSKGRRAGAEQQAVDQLLVLQSERGKLMRQGEDHMEVADGQDFGLPLGHPAVASRGLALGAMAVTAGVIRDGSSWPHLVHRSRWPPSAAVRQRAMARSTFRCDQCSQRRLFSMKPAPRSANDVSHLDGWPVHFLARFTLPSPRWCEERPAIWSSGLATAIQVLPGQMQIDGRCPGCRRGRAAPEWWADRRRLPAGGWRSCAAGYAGERAW